MSNGSPTMRSKSSFHFAAGLGSGVLSAVLLQPIDLLKTRVQQGGRAGIGSGVAGLSSGLGSISPGRHTLSAAIAELRASSTHLIPALWRGALPSALRTGFGSAIYFSSLNAIRQNVARARLPVLTDTASLAATGSSSSSLPKLSNTGNLAAGAVARSLAGFVLMPLTVLKVRYESSMYAYTSLAGAARDMARTEGLRGFFAGFGATAIRDAPYAGLYVLFYEQSKRRLSALYDGTTSSSDGTATEIAPSQAMGVSRAASINFASGVVSGVVCSIISNPFDAVKTRIQLQPGAYRNLVQAGRRLVAEEGFRALWDGLALRMSRKALSSALAWTVYEELIRRAEVTWSDRTAQRSL
ncbi:mitochondrial carrier domain-containing protein [Lasiosphaeria ovina]|uniref:Mitochondrial glycine transporter n=1 Tax=Lasiosphaeria ovina TaxID=92902 RepID=A0AAE0NLB2_9PEZI|nr:mitochondrial carrier domain-containing protein [Lasiosphaeria ovina]